MSQIDTVIAANTLPSLALPLIASADIRGDVVFSALPPPAPISATPHDTVRISSEARGTSGSEV
ncbi:MAG: hypothetical protein D6690_12795 [Nitrospirae bacterium]|nr:MAG: hypothetical protein D6690_12795 [Nitrospirota bacterium]